jgi:response regulator NasT
MLNTNTMTANTILISDSSESNDILENVLLENEYKLIYNGTSLKHLLMQETLNEPELIIINVDRPEHGMIDQLKVINQQYPLPIVIFTKDDRDEAIGHAIQAGVSAYVVDGLSESRIVPILRTAMLRFEQHQSVQQELAELKTTLADRKVIDRAKGLIMAQRSCTEDEAYKLMRSTAMNQNIRLAALAQNIIDTAKLLEPKN